MIGGTLARSSTHERRIKDDLESLYSCLPPAIADRLRRDPRQPDLLEVVLDLGRQPEARFLQGEQVLSEHEVTSADLDYVVERVGRFNDDNRAGIERTLHRISCIRNRTGRVVGLTCRVGRAVFGTIRIIEDLVVSGKNILLLGRPGVGKTTMLREIARVLADDFNKRVIIVDTSNEIAGDGDIPHPSLGRARRMQVPQPHLQHHVMIEAVENHMPEVIVIDEIGTEAEASAARTIAERGVQLVGTAHGTNLENLILNPTLADLIGGIQPVILGDEEARRRRTRKTVLERKAPPTFDIVVEIRSREQVAIHSDVAKTVDQLLRGVPPHPLLRTMTASGEVVPTQPAATAGFGAPQPTEHRAPRGRPGVEEPAPRRPAFQAEEEPEIEESPAARTKQETTDLFPYGIGRVKLEETLHALKLPVRLVDNVSGADVLMTTKQMYRRKAEPIQAAEGAGIPVYVLRKNTPLQLEQALTAISGAIGKGDLSETAMEETERAIDRILSGEVSEVELSPQNSYMRRLQHQLAEQYGVTSRSSGREPNRRVRLSRSDGLRAATG